MTEQILTPGSVETDAPRAYIATDGLLRAYGTLPAKYTQEALQGAVQHYADTALPALGAAHDAAHNISRGMADAVRWGAISSWSAYDYCARHGLPMPKLVTP